MSRCCNQASTLQSKKTPIGLDANILKEAISMPKGSALNYYEHYPKVALGEKRFEAQCRLPCYGPFPG
jgi:hypothetical protein